MKTKTLLNRLIQARVCCFACGKTYGKVTPGLMSSVNTGKACDVCKKKTGVTETRDFGYLKAGRKALQLVIDKERKAKLEDRLNRVKEYATTRVKNIKEKRKPDGINAMKKELKKVTHKIVRLTYDTCASCGKYVEPSDRHAGHFHTDGGHPLTRYDFDNLRTQHSVCNYHKGGDSGYAAYLLRQIGVERFLALADRSKMEKRWNKQEIEAMLIERREILKKLEDNQ